MATIILGIGQQKDFQSVLDVAEDEMIKSEGQPRRIVGKSGMVDFEAERGGFEGPFETFVIRVEAIGELKQKIAGIASGASENICDIFYDEDTERTILTLPAPDCDIETIDFDEIRKAVETVFSLFTIPEVWRFTGEKYNLEPVSIELLFRALIQYKASDIHLSPGEKPIFRIDNKMRVSDLMEPLSGPQILNLIKQLSPDEDWKRFEKESQNSFSFHQKGIGYARTSAFLKAGQPHLTFRYHPEGLPTFEDLNVPVDIMLKLAQLHNGLILIVGMTGSGKSTSGAALLDWINRNRKCHILTLEDPVEYHHYSKSSTVSQRNVGIDCPSFELGVEGALRHDPDVILVGEMRDPNTIRAAISAAATGHLVLSTLHANDASSVINRVCSFFEPVERELVRAQMNECTRVIICQKLIEKKGGGRIPALEMMFNDVKQISDAIIAGDSNKIRQGMQQSLSASKLFEFFLYEKFKEETITLETAQQYAPEISMFEQLRMGTYSVPKMQ